MKTVQQWACAIVGIVLIIAVLVIIIISATKSNPSNSESLMLGILISVFSIMIGLLANHLYFSLGAQSSVEDAKKSFDEKIRTFGRKAAEKVFNLSNEFDRMVDSLKVALEESQGEEKDKITILVLREKILSAIHLLETLKSMNDTSLSDWKGIIGDDIQLQRELQREISEELDEQRELIEKLQSQVDGEGSKATEQRVRQIEEKLLQKMAALPFSFRPVRIRPRKQDVQVNCPSCGVPTTIKARPRHGAAKAFQCSGCKHFVMAKYESETECRPEMVPEITMKANCHLCKEDINFQMPDVGGTMVKVACEQCGSIMSAVKTRDGVKYQSVSSKNLSSKFLELVLENIPEKPWPQGMHEAVAKKMGIPVKVIERSIGLLMSAGRLENGAPIVVGTLANAAAKDAAAMEAPGSTVH